MQSVDSARLVLSAPPTLAELMLSVLTHKKGLKVGALAIIRDGAQLLMETSGERWEFCLLYDRSFGSHLLTVRITEGVVPADDTITRVAGISPEQWSSYKRDYLFLSPPSDSYTAPGVGTLLLDSAFAGKLFVKGFFIAGDVEGMTEHGVDLFSIEVRGGRK